jgi:hypothetical protein
MGMTFDLVLEDHKTIEGYIKHLDSLIVKLRNLNQLTDKNKQELILIYNDDILPWVENYYLFGKELTPKEESEMIDFILDIINTATKILNKYEKI